MTREQDEKLNRIVEMVAFCAAYYMVDKEISEILKRPNSHFFKYSNAEITDTMNFITDLATVTLPNKLIETLENSKNL